MCLFLLGKNPTRGGGGLSLFLVNFMMFTAHYQLFLKQIGAYLIGLFAVDISSVGNIIYKVGHTKEFERRFQIEHFMRRSKESEHIFY